MVRTQLRSPATARRRSRRRNWHEHLVGLGHQVIRTVWAPEPATSEAIGLDHRRARWAALVRYHLGPMAFFGLIAVLVTYPLVFHLTTHLPSDVSDGGDAYQNYWNFWWVRQALSAGQNPYWTPLLYAPDGAPLYLHTLNPFNGLVSIPVQFALGLTVAYNAVLFVSLVLAGYFAYLLVTRVSGSREAGLVGGAVYAFGSYHMMRVQGHTNLLASEWLPAYVLCLVLANASTGRRRTLLVGAGAGSLILAMLCDWHFVVFALFFTVVYTSHAALSRRSVTPILVAGAIGCLWFIVSLPLLGATLAEIGSGATVLPTMDAVRRGSSDLTTFAIPGSLQALWRPWLERLGGQIPTYGQEQQGGFLGYVSLALAALAAWRERRRTSVWVIAALVSLLMSLGPYLQVAGNWRFGEAGWSVPLPYQLLQQLPGLNMMRVPTRFSVLVTLCLSVLVGLGIASLARRWTSRPRTRLVCVPLLLAVLLAEHLAIPLPLVPVSVPPFYAQLGASGEDGTVMEWPFCKQCAWTNLYQTVHGRPVVGGYISRRRGYAIRGLPPYRILPEPPCDICLGEVSPSIGVWALHYSGVRWIVVNFDDPNLNRDELPEFLARYASPSPIYEDAQMAVYRPRPLEEAPVSYLELVETGHNLERLPDRQAPMRWFPAAATFNAWAFVAGTQDYVLGFDVWSYQQPRRLEVRVDGRAIGQYLIANTEQTGPQRLDVHLTLGTGNHQIELRSLDPPISPAQAGINTDTRPLAFALSNVELRHRP